MEAQLSHLHSPRLPRLVSQLEPLLPGKQGDNKRKRLNAVLDKLTNNINKVSEDASGGDEPDSPDKSLEIELNVKTKFRKEESEDTSGKSECFVSYQLLSISRSDLSLLIIEIIIQKSLLTSLFL